MQETHAVSTSPHRQGVRLTSAINNALYGGRHVDAAGIWYPFGFCRRDGSSGGVAGRFGQGSFLPGFLLRFGIEYCSFSISVFREASLDRLLSLRTPLTIELRIVFVHLETRVRAGWEASRSRRSDKTISCSP